MKYNLKKLVFSSSLIGLIALSSCGVNSTEVNKVYSSCNIVNKKLADYNISSDDYKLFIEKLNSFSAKSSANILDKNTNAISPLSLYMNLAMTSTITSGNTYNELINFLDIDYNDISNLRIEARQKLSKIKPENIGQASRISGVSPADVSVLLVYLKMKNRE